MDRAWLVARYEPRVSVGVLAGLLALALTVALFATARPATAQPCEFRLGFQTFASLAPDVVGACVEDEHFDVASSVSLQRTSKGTLVWRKDTNAVEFSDGSAAWALGSNGLEKRPVETELALEAVIPTQVVDFQAPTSSSAQEQGSCWTGSVVVGRAGAWRCMSGNRIYDPCFELPGGGNALACAVRPPWEEQPGVKLTLTEPLPEARGNVSLRGPRAWAIELDDGVRCAHMQGTVPAVDGVPAPYSCGNGRYILGEPRGDAVWTATEIQVATDPLFAVLSSHDVGVKRAWR